MVFSVHTKIIVALFLIVNSRARSRRCQENRLLNRKNALLRRSIIISTVIPLTISESITGAFLLPQFTVPAILRVSHLWHERRCRPPQMRMRAKPAPLYYSQQTGSAKGRQLKKKTAPGR